MYAAGTITFIGTQRQELINQWFTTITHGIKNHVVRSYISDYIITAKPIEQQVDGTIALINLAELAEKNKWRGAADLALNHDKYFLESWGKEKTGKRDGK